MNAGYKQVTNDAAASNALRAKMLAQQTASKPVASAAPAPVAAPATAMAPALPPAPISTAPVPPSGNKILEPEPDSMAGLQAAAGGGGGDFSGSAGDEISGPSKFRQGVGQRIPPQYSAALAGLRQAY